MRATLLLFASIAALNILLLVATSRPPHASVFRATGKLANKLVGTLLRTPAEAYPTEPFKKAWLRTLKSDLADWNVITRRQIFNAAILGSPMAATYQITSDKQIFIAPPPIPGWMKDKGFHAAFKAFTLTTATMLQLMLRDMEAVPNVTFTFKWGDNCLHEFTTTRLLPRLATLKTVGQKKINDSGAASTAWTAWVAEEGEEEDAKRGMRGPRSPARSPVADAIAPPLFYHRARGSSHSLDCVSTSMAGYDSLMYDVVLNMTGELNSEWPSTVPWEQRRPKMIWRGTNKIDSVPLTPSVVGGGKRRHQASVRARAALAGGARPDILDIKLLETWREKENPERKAEGDVYGKRMDYNAQRRYRYVINMDGHGFSSRLRIQLLSGSLVFKVDSPIHQYWTDPSDFKPWVHFIPVSWGELQDDLPRKVEWAIQNDARAHSIAQAGRLFAQERLKDASTAWHMQQVVREYAKRQRGNFSIIPGSVPFCCSHVSLLAGIYHLQPMWSDACERFTEGGWAPACPPSPELPNPALRALGLSK